MRIFCVVAGLALLVTSGAFAQETRSGSVSGTVVAESNRRPLELVNVVLLDQSDSTLVTATATDRHGQFRIDSIARGRYFLHFSLIGYREAVFEHVDLDSTRSDLIVGTITLKAAAIRLDEVAVTADKPVLHNSIDRKVYNVQRDLLSTSGSASDLLQNIPSVQVDIDGTVSLRGSANVLMLVNGKPSPLLGKNRAEVLQQMPGSSIERVEVMTNPSARFKPDGTSGIINIVLKKSAAAGLNGTPSANVGNHRRFHGGATLNYNPGSYNLYGSYDYRQDQRNSFMTDERSQPDPATGGGTNYRQHVASLSQPVSQIGTLGLDYTLDPRNRLGFSGEYRHRGFTRRETSTVSATTTGGTVISDYDRLRVDPEFEDEAGANAFYEHDFRKADHTLRAEVHVAHSPEIEDNHYTNVYRTPRAPVGYDNMRIKQAENQQQVTVDYSNALTEHSTLESGYAGEFNKTDMDNRGEFFDAAQQRFVRDAGTSSRFIYKEAIHALYGTYGDTFGRFSVLGGLRVEHSSVHADLVTDTVTVVNDYFKLYPTLHLAYKLSEAGELQLNYSRRANRPEGEDLNPFPEYVDPRNIRTGNPRLRPELIHSIELGCRLQNEAGSLVPSIFYRRKYDGITAVTRSLNDSTLLTTRENLGKDESAGLELVLGWNAGGVLSTNASGSAFYETIDASNLGFGARKSTVTWSGTFSSNLNLSTGTMLQLNSTYRSSRLTPQGKYLASVVFNVGARQELWRDKLSVVLTVSDVFKTLNRKMELDTSWLQQTVVTNRDSRIGYLGVAYHLGKPPKKTKEKSLPYDNGL
jgi:outer membrane receptor protein involved in Fe transport